MAPDPTTVGTATPALPSTDPSADHLAPDHHHRDVSGGWLRPAVFGVMDGLVTNLSLIAGVGGGGATAGTIVLTGLAGLVAGAFSMATGEYTSVSSQNELVAAEVALERRQLERAPEAERRELADTLVRRGVDRELADQVADQLSRDPDIALRVHAQEELGVDPGDLPSPWTAAGSSFVSFSLGAFVPLVPYVAGASMLWLALVCGGVALVAAGAAVARLTDRPPLVGAARQLLLGGLAVSVTYGIGELIGTTVT